MEKKLSQKDFRKKMPFNIEFCQQLFANYFTYGVMIPIANLPSFVKQIYTSLQQDKKNISIEIPVSLPAVAEMSKYMAIELMRCGQITYIEQFTTLVSPVNLLTGVSKVFLSEDQILNIYGIELGYSVKLGTSSIILSNMKAANQGPQNQLKFVITIDISPLSKCVLYNMDDSENLNYYIPYIKTIKTKTRKTKVEENLLVQYLDVTTFFNLLVVNYLFTSKGSKIDDTFLTISELLSNTIKSNLLVNFNEKAELITLDIPDKNSMLSGRAQRSAIISFSSTI